MITDNTEMDSRASATDKANRQLTTDNRQLITDILPHRTPIYKHTFRRHKTKSSIRILSHQYHTL